MSTVEPVFPNAVVPVESRSKWTPQSKRRMLWGGLLLVLVVVVIYLVWSRRNLTPNCAQYSSNAALACSAGVLGCQGDKPCLNAVARCMPLANGIQNASSVQDYVGYLARNQSQLKGCARAISQIDPRVVSGALAKAVPTACVPANVGAASKQIPAAAGYNALVGMASAVAPLVPWAVQVANDLPACAAATRHRRRSKNRARLFG